MDIDVPRDREGSFEPLIVEKRYIAQTIEEIYGFEASKDMISRITDKILPEINEW